jgi:hypothetical protein
MDQADLETFRLRFRMALIERLTIKTFFLATHVQGLLTVAQTETGLGELLDGESAEALRVYGLALGDPGLTALFADEAKEITDSVKKTVGEIAVFAQGHLGKDDRSCRPHRRVSQRTAGKIT